MKIKGNADSLSTINKFVDTLKFTTFKANGDSPKEGKAFNEVVLSAFGIDEGSTGPGNLTSYEITLKFDPAIFATTKGPSGSNVSLVVPQIISTRSETEKPDTLFAPQPAKPQPAEQGR